MKLVVAAAVCLCATAVPVARQGMDMAAIQRWSRATVAHYHVEGVFQSWTDVAAGNGNQGQVNDKLTLDFDWDLQENKVVGTPAFVNAKASVGVLRGSLASCPAPVLKGEYEHFTATGTVAGAGEPRLAVNGTRTFPAATVAEQCPSSLTLSPVAGKTETVVEYLPVPNPMLLAVRGANQSNISVAPDGRSFIAKLGGWTWTYTPTFVR